MKNRLFLLILVVLVPRLLLAQAPDLLRSFNGGFEEGLRYWRFFEVPSPLGSTAEIETTQVAEGRKAVKLTFVPPSNSLQDRGFDNWNAGVPVVAGGTYTVSVQAKTEGNSGVYLSVVLGFFDVNRKVIEQGTKSFALGESFQTFSLQRKAPVEAAFCWVAFRLLRADGGFASGLLFLDDARVTGPDVRTVVRPRVMPTQFPSEDVPIASLNVTESPFNARNDGSEDATAAFQSAINTAAAAGGAVVFIPAGRYRFEGTLIVHERVILRGEWQSPEKNPAVAGTVLMPTAGQGEADGTPFLQLERGSGVRDLSIWYPNQSAPSPIPYPWTILCNPDTETGKGNNTTVQDVTLVNAYRGIKIGPAWNELHTLRHVYGTPLETGIWLSYTTDIGRIEEVHFEPKFWAQSGLAGAPSEAAILGFTQQNGEGLALGRSDWEYLYHVSLVGYRTGIHIFRDLAHGTSNGVIYGARIEKSHVGLQIDETNGVGFVVEASTIRASAGLDPLCVEAGARFTSLVEFNTCTFGGTPEFAVFFDPACTGRLTFQNCTFETWQTNMDSAGVYCESGSLALMGCTFQKEATQVHLGDHVTSAWILDNHFAGGKMRIVNESQGEVFFSQENLSLQKWTMPPFQEPPFPRPLKEDLYNVFDYGAVGDGQTDNTSAFQAALNAAGENGGGTVYVPAGWYRFTGHLRVPTGVELRGIWDVPHHTVSKGSVLLVTEGRGNPEGPPFLSLSQGSGVRGVTFWYPNQTTTTFDPYPWTIRALGPNDWVKDVTIGNAYQGVDFGRNPSEGHVLDYVAGSPLKTGIYVSKNAGEGWLENVQFNPHYWMRSPGYPKTREPDFQTLVAYQQSHLDAFTLGSCQREHVLGTFVYAANRGLYFSDEGLSCHADVFLHGTDAGSYGVFLDSPAGSELNFAATQLVLLGATPSGIVASGSHFAGDAKFYGLLAWGSHGGPTAVLNGTGRVLLQQVHTDNGAFQFNGGAVRVENSVIKRKLNPPFVVNSGIDSARIFGVWAKGGFEMTNRAGSRVEADYNVGQSRSGVELKTGWEAGDPPDNWENTLYGETGVFLKRDSSLVCRAEVLDSAHTGQRGLVVSAVHVSNLPSKLTFKILRVQVPIYHSSEVTYFLRPADSGGRGVFVDFLFSDGTRLTEIAPTLVDSLRHLTSGIGLNRWQKIEYPVGHYAAGKQLQEVLVCFHGTGGDETFRADLDDLRLTTPHPLPEGWQKSDIGGARPSGYAVFDREKVFLFGGGYGIPGYAKDSFTFVYRKVTGDFDISACLESSTELGRTAFAGIFARDSTAGKSPFAAVLLQPRYGVYAKWRSTPGAFSGSRGAGAPVFKPPLWFRLIRRGDRFFSLFSKDGHSWIALDTVTVEMGRTALLGFGASGGSVDRLLQAVFTDWQIQQPNWVPSRRAGGPFIPKTLFLHQNYPNPFRANTRIVFGLPKPLRVRLSVVNTLGQCVTTLLEGKQRAGFYIVHWNGRDKRGRCLPRGVYFCVFRGGNRRLIKKMVLLKP